MSFRFLYDPQRQPPRHRLPRRRRGGAGPARPLPLRPARLGGAPRQLHRASPRATSPRSTGSTWAAPSPACTAYPTLLSWSATLFEYLMPLLLMRSYPDTLLDESCRMAVRRQRDYAGERGRAVGDLGVRLRPRRSPRQLPVQGVRRARAGPEAGPRRRAGGRALRDGARRARRPHRGGGEPPAPGAGGPRSARTASTTPSTTRPGAPEEPEATTPGPARTRGHGSCARTSPTTRG